MGDIGIHDPKSRAIRDGFHWIQECIALGERHQCQNAFLLAGDRSLLFDTLTRPNGEEIVARVEDILDGDDLDFLVISHPEGNHSGNAVRILDAYPDATLVAPGRGVGPGEGFGGEHELYHIGQSGDAPMQVDNEVWYVSGGETIDLGGYEVEFTRAYYADHSFSTWMVEHATNTLFTVDWLGFWHPNDQCLAYGGDIDDDTVADYLRGFHGNVFPWLQFADVGKVEATVDDLRATYDPDWLAPAHGMVVKEDPDRYVDLFVETVRALSERGEPDALRERIDEMFPTLEAGR